MKIGTKISLFYTVITMCIIFIVTMVFYLSTTRYVNSLFDSYLAEKAVLTAQKYWEKDEIDDDSYMQIQKRYNELLPQAKEILFDADNPDVLRDSLAVYLNSTQKKNLFNGKAIAFNHNKLRGTALYYPDNEGNFVVIVMAQNKYGKDIIRHIMALAGIIMIIACFVVYIMGKVYSNKILFPLKSILKELKHIRANNLKIRLKKLNNKDELEELTNSLNNMLDNIDNAFQSEKSFINNASHELNNPLTAIQGECDITLKRERSVKEYTEALQRISSESRRLSQLTKNLLFLARADRDFQKESLETIILSDFLKDITYKEDRINLCIGNDAKNLQMETNRLLFKTAIMNIIDNALKYSDKNIDIRLYQDNCKICIEVKDYGIGIPKEDIKHIYQSFYRGKNTRNFYGQGIGLNLSMKIISLHDGHIEIESEENKYTSVKVILKTPSL